MKSSVVVLVLVAVAAVVVLMVLRNRQASPPVSSYVANPGGSSGDWSQSMNAPYDPNARSWGGWSW